jgi:hypothetical protein
MCQIGILSDQEVSSFNEGTKGHIGEFLGSLLFTSVTMRDRITRVVKLVKSYIYRNAKLKC